MRKVAVILLVLMNFMIIAQPAWAESEYSRKIVFQETLTSEGTTKYFNPENSTTLPQELNLTQGIYKGPQYPFAAVRLDIRDYTRVWLNFSLNLTYQDIMNGAYRWKLLIPVSGNFTLWELDLNGKYIAGSYTKYEEPGDVPYPNSTISMRTTKYGILFEFLYALYPEQYNFTFYFITYSSPTLYLCRENQNSMLTIIQANKTVYNIHAAYAFLFERGFGQKGMGGITGQQISFYFIDYATSNSTFTTIGLPVWVPAGTILTLRIHEYINGSEIFYVNKSFPTTGFYYIFQSSSRPANYSILSYYSVQFDFIFSQPVKFLFCTLAPSPHQYSSGVYAGDTVTFNGRRFDYFGIVYWHHVGSDQFAQVTKYGNITIYDFGFASVQEYSTGDYVIVPYGNWQKYVLIKNRTVKSIGAKVDEILFGGAFEFSANNDILSILIGGITKVYDLIKKTLEFLQRIGQIIWKNLLKFWKWLVDLYSWITDSMGSIFNYVVYMIIPVGLIFTVSFISRLAKGLKAAEEGVKA